MTTRHGTHCKECLKLLTVDESLGSFSITCTHGLSLCSASRRLHQQSEVSFSVDYGGECSDSPVMNSSVEASSGMATNSPTVKPAHHLNDPHGCGISDVVVMADDSADDGELLRMECKEQFGPLLVDEEVITLTSATTGLRQQVSLLNSDGDINIRCNFVDDNNDDDDAMVRLVNENEGLEEDGDDDDDSDEGEGDGDGIEGVGDVDHAQNKYDNGNDGDDDDDDDMDNNIIAKDGGGIAVGLSEGSHRSYLAPGVQHLGMPSLLGCVNQDRPNDHAEVDFDQKDGGSGKWRFESHEDGGHCKDRSHLAAGDLSVGPDGEFSLTETKTTTAVDVRKRRSKVMEWSNMEFDSEGHDRAERCDCHSVLSHLSHQPHHGQHVKDAGVMPRLQKRKSSSSFVCWLLLLLLLLLLAGILLLVVCHMRPSLGHQLQPFGLSFHWALRHVGTAPPL